MASENQKYPDDKERYDANYERIWRKVPITNTDTEDEEDE